MGNVVRIGDKLTCGSAAAAGSGTVMANGKPISTQTYNATTGHECNPPSYFVGPWTKTVFIEGTLVTTNGNKYAGPTAQELHLCSALRRGHKGVASAASPDVSFDQ